MALRDYFGPIKEVRANFLGHTIVVRNAAWPANDIKNPFSTEAKLFIDGQVVDTNTALIAFKDVGVLSGSITEGGKTHMIEVYVKQRLKLKIKICADSTFIGGDNF